MDERNAETDELIASLARCLSKTSARIGLARMTKQVTHW